VDNLVNRIVGRTVYGCFRCRFKLVMLGWLRNNQLRSGKKEVSNALETILPQSGYLKFRPYKTGLGNLRPAWTFDMDRITFFDLCFNPFLMKTDGCYSCILCIGVRVAFSIEKVTSQSWQRAKHVFELHSSVFRTQIPIDKQKHVSCKL